MRFEVPPPVFDALEHEWPLVRALQGKRLPLPVLCGHVCGTKSAGAIDRGNTTQLRSHSCLARWVTVRMAQAAVRGCVCGDG